ncbi:YHS domain-containing protein [Clostridium fungisolvens]|uniref:TRASH domain-containing protein n=1 Tax=Clostridium fungisolvens TaxID=1604897 RepID=A0A6V8SFA3_9CLOT|nr:YHS domain-containing protein [Clostridium fungisolvens]GFP75730.1 hypothetical protein bsdtw1_01822 [Clostridium fungisolvens]
MEFLANNWIYMLVTVIMVFVMVKRGGCCGGHSHENEFENGNSHGGGCCGGSSNHNHSDESNKQIDQSNLVKDPICGMMVNPETAIKQIIDGQTYYFCSEGCRREFIRKQS